jgi:hypothetical protein
MISFEDARILAEGFPELRDLFPLNDFGIADYGWEDKSKYLLVAGTLNEINGQADLMSLSVDPPSVYVDKTTGNISVQFGLKSYAEPTAGMTPIGPVPA